MADRNVIGMAMELDVTDITSGLSQVSKAITQSNTDFKKATAGMENWSKTSEGLTAKLDQLTTNLELQKKGASGLEAEIKRLQESEGDHSAEIERAKKKLDNYQIQIATTEKEIKKYTTALEDTQKKEQTAQSATSKLTDELKSQKSQLSDLEKEYKDAVLTYGKNSKEAQSLEKQIKKLSSEIKTNESRVDEADKAYKELTDTLEDSQDEVEDTQKSYTSLGDVLDSLKSVSAVAVGVVGAVATAVIGLGKSFLETAESTKEFRTNMAKVNASCEEAGFSSATATKYFDEFYKLLGDEGKTTEAVSHLSKLVDTEEELSEWTNICAGVYALFGDSIPIEGLTEASNETAKTGELTGQLGDALKRVGVSEDEFKARLEECNTEQERQNLITSTLKDLYAEIGKTYRETNVDIIEANEANLRLSKAMAEIGAIAEPLQTKITNLKASFVEFAGDVVKALSGQGISADELSIALDTLKVASENVKKAQDDMKTSLDATSKSSYFESQVALFSAIDTVSASYAKASEQSKKYRQELEDAEKAINVYKGLVDRAVKETGLTIDELYQKYILWEQGVGGAVDIIGQGAYEDRIAMTKAVGAYYDALQAEENARSQFAGWEKTLGNYVKVLAEIVNQGSVSLETISLYSEELAKDIKEYLEYSNSATSKIVANNNVIAESTKEVVDANEEVGISVEENQKRVEDSQRRGISQTQHYTEQIKEQNDAQAKAVEDAQKRAQDAQQKGVSQTKYWRQRQAEEIEKSKSAWQKFGENIKGVLDGAESSMNNWKSNTGKYLSQVAGYFDTAKGYLTDMGNAIYSYYEQENQMQQDALQKQIDTLKSNNAETIKQIEETGQKQIEEAEEIYKNQLAQLETRLANGEITEEQYATAKEQRESAYATRKATLEKQISDTTTSIQQQTDAKERKLMAEKDRLGREAFEANKKVQIATIAVNTASAIIRAFAELGWIAGLVASAALGVTAGIQIAKINKQQYTPVALAKGGITQGATQALIGEDGKEAVLPLEKNTGWIDMLASRLNTVMQRDVSNTMTTSYGARNISNNYTQIINAPKTPSRRELYRDGKNLLALKGAF